MAGKLTEIENYAWVISAGNRRWLYDGPKTGLKATVERVKDMPANAGRTVRTRQVVSD
jgi:hypothetical protein